MVVVGDARSLPVGGGVVQCVVTSPPYWGLRDYGTARWEGGDAACDHSASRDQHRGTFDGGMPASARDSLAGSTSCRKCGARRIDAQLGLEATPDLYVASMVAVFREVRRVLRDDGVVFLNLGDSYAATHTGTLGRGERADNFNFAESRLDAQGKGGRKEQFIPPGLKPKDLVGIPWRVAFALQADGWWLRSDIIWAKPNPMPESVTDRPTKSHEYVFLLTKSARYYWDAEAVAERGASVREFREDTRGDGADSMERGRASRQALGPSGFGATGTRNLRSVWSIATQPYPEAHFATMPEKLVEPCIKAGSRPGDLVLDPFAGSGTVGKVALELNRRFVGVELNPAYVGMARRRMSGVQPQLLEAL